MAEAPKKLATLGRVKASILVDQWFPNLTAALGPSLKPSLPGRAAEYLRDQQYPGIKARTARRQPTPSQGQG